MKRWLHDEGMPARLQHVRNLAEEPGLVRHLVNHVEEKHEVDWSGDAYAVDTAAVQRDAPLELRTCDLPLHLLQHPVLKVRRNDSTGLANQLRHWNREEPRAAADIQNGHALVMEGQQLAYQPRPVLA